MYELLVSLNSIWISQTWVFVLAGCCLSSNLVHSKHCSAWDIFLLITDMLVRYLSGVFQHWRVSKCYQHRQKLLWKWWEGHAFVESSRDLHPPSESFCAAELSNFKSRFHWPHSNICLVLVMPVEMLCISSLSNRAGSKVEIFFFQPKH